MSGAVAPAPAAARAGTPPLRVVGTLAGFGALAGFLLVVAYDSTQPRIAAHKAALLGRAVKEVLREPARFETLYWKDGALGKETSPDRIFVGWNADGSCAGYAIDAAAPGFADTVRVLFGYDARNRALLGMKVLESKETPGLGDKIEKDEAFVRGFSGAKTPLRGVKPGAGTGAAGEIDMITGATISSRAVLRIINDALARYGPAIDAHASEANR